MGVETRCLRVRLKLGSLPEVRVWAAELNRRLPEVKATLQAEGVELEAVFLDERPEAASLIYVMRAADFEHAIKVARASPAPIDAYHQAFKQSCWEERQPLECLLDVTP